MHISPPNVSAPVSGHPVETRSPLKTSKSVFQRPGQAKAKAKPAKLILSRDELIAIASDLNSGLINREQANSRFVAAVIDHSLKGKLGDEDREKMIGDIRDFFADDQEFSQKLAKNLHDLI